MSLGHLRFFTSANNVSVWLLTLGIHIRLRLKRSGTNKQCFAAVARSGKGQHKGRGKRTVPVRLRGATPPFCGGEREREKKKEPTD